MTKFRGTFFRAHYILLFDRRESGCESTEREARATNPFFQYGRVESNTGTKQEVAFSDPLTLGISLPGDFVILLQPSRGCTHPFVRVFAAIRRARPFPG